MLLKKTFIKNLINLKLKKSKNKFLLNKEQKKSISFLRNIGKRYSVTVLEGVTGSGKTLVYFERIKDILVKKVSSFNIASRNCFNKSV